MNLKKLLITVFAFTMAGVGFAQTSETAYLPHNAYTKIAEEKARKANYIQRAVRLQMNYAAKKSAARAHAQPGVKSYNKAGASSSPKMVPAGFAGGVAGGAAVVEGPARTAARTGAVASLYTRTPVGAAGGMAGASPASARRPIARKTKPTNVKEAFASIRSFFRDMVAFSLI